MLSACAGAVGAVSLGQAASSSPNDSFSLCFWTLLFPSLTSTTRSSSDALQRRYGAPELEVSSFPFLPLLQPISQDSLYVLVFSFFLPFS